MVAGFLLEVLIGYALLTSPLGRSGLRNVPVMAIEPFVQRTAEKFRQVKPVTELKIGLGNICYQGKEQIGMEAKL